MIRFDHVIRNGISYDWNKRKIYPVYQNLNIDNLTVDKLKELLWANVNFALLGDYSLLENMSINSKKANDNSLKDYFAKYEKFFIEDYRWTINNFENMSKNKENIENWYHNNDGLIEHHQTIDYYAYLSKHEKSFNDKVKVIFNDVFER